MFPSSCSYDLYENCSHCWTWADEQGLKLSLCSSHNWWSFRAWLPYLWRKHSDGGVPVRCLRQLMGFQSLAALPVVGTFWWRCPREMPQTTDGVSEPGCLTCGGNILMEESLWDASDNWWGFKAWLPYLWREHSDGRVPVRYLRGLLSQSGFFLHQRQLIVGCHRLHLIVNVLWQNPNTTDCQGCS